MTPRPDRAADSVVFFNFRPDRARQLSQRLLAAGFDLTTMTRYRDDSRLPGGARRAGRRRYDRRGARSARPEPAPHRGDREVRARHVLPERRGSGVGGRGSDPRAVAAGRRDVRPEAGDVSRRGNRPARRRAPATATTGSSSSTTQTPTWSDTPARSRRRRSRRSRRRLPGPDCRGRPRQQPARVSSARITETPSRCSRRRHEPAHGTHDEPGPACARRGRAAAGTASATAARWPTSRRRASACSASSRPRDVGTRSGRRHQT